MEILGVIGAFAALASIVVGIGSAVSQGINNEKNLKQQEELLQYQKDVQNTTWEREDTAMQRAMADYEAAGVNPLLALGNPYGSGSVVETSAPQRKNIDFSGIQSALKGLENPYKFEEEYLDYQAKRKQNEQLTLQNQQLTTANSERELALEIARHNFEWYKKNNLPTNASGLPKQFSEGRSLLQEWLDRAKGNIDNYIADDAQDKPLLDYIFPDNSPVDSHTGLSHKQMERTANRINRKYKWEKFKDSFKLSRKSYKDKYSKKF